RGHGATIHKLAAAAEPGHHRARLGRHLPEALCGVEAGHRPGEGEVRCQRHRAEIPLPSDPRVVVAAHNIQNGHEPSRVPARPIRAYPYRPRGRGRTNRSGPRPPAPVAVLPSTAIAVRGPAPLCPPPSPSPELAPLEGHA